MGSNEAATCANTAYFYMITAFVLEPGIPDSDGQPGVALRVLWPD